MNIDAAFPSNFIKASDLGDLGDVGDVTMSRVVLEELGRGSEKETKPILYFKESPKGLVLNKTNAKKIAEIVGSNNTDKWIGKRIRLVVTEVEFQGKVGPGIRVRPVPTGAPKKSASKPKTADAPPLDGNDDTPL